MTFDRASKTKVVLFYAVFIWSYGEKSNTDHLVILLIRYDHSNKKLHMLKQCIVLVDWSSMTLVVVVALFSF